MVKANFTRVGNGGLACLEWCLRGCSVAFAVLIPAMVRSEMEIWIAVSAAGFCVGACQGLLVLVGRAQKERAVRTASEAISTMLQDRINNDLAVILASVSSRPIPGSPQVVETVNRRVLSISGQLNDISAEAVARWQERHREGPGAGTDENWRRQSCR